MKYRQNAKNPLEFFLRCITMLVVAFTLLMVVLTLFTVSTVDRNERSIFGTHFYIVRTDSMSLSEKNKDDKVHFNAGDVILIQKVKDASALAVGDVIAFISANRDSYGETITHRIRSVKTGENGEVLGYETYGTKTGVSDEATVTPSAVLGRYVGKIPNLGKYFALMRTPRGYFTFILFPFLILILYHSVNTARLYALYRALQEEALRLSRLSLSGGCQGSRRAMADLILLRAELSAMSEKKGRG